MHTPLFGCWLIDGEEKGWRQVETVQKGGLGAKNDDDENGDDGVGVWSHPSRCSQGEREREGRQTMSGFKVAAAAAATWNEKSKGKNVLLDLSPELDRVVKLINKLCKKFGDIIGMG